MESLKSLLGAGYHDGITVEEINKFLDGKKFVNLSDGGYIVKEKYDRLKAEHDELVKGTADHENIVKELNQLKAEKEVAETRKSLIDAGVDEKFVEYLGFQVEKGVIKKDGKFVDNVKAYLKENAQYAKQQSNPNDPKPLFVQTKLPNGDNKGKVDNSSINDAFRKIAGTSGS